MKREFVGWGEEEKQTITRGWVGRRRRTCLRMARTTRAPGRVRKVMRLGIQGNHTHSGRFVPCRSSTCEVGRLGGWVGEKGVYRYSG